MLERINESVGSAVGAIVLFVPRFLAFAAILLIGYLIAKAIEKGMDAILERLGFDRVVDRGGIRRMLARSRYDASSLLSKIVFYIVMLFVLQLSFGVFGPNPVTDMLNAVVAYLPNVFAAGLIVIIGAAIAAALRDIVVSALGGLSYGRALGTAASIAVLVVAGFAALDQLNIAPAIVTGLFYAILAVVVGVLVVAVGGAGIQPMREYWSRFLLRIDRETPQMAEAMKHAPEATREVMRERQEQAERTMVGTTGRAQGAPR